MKPRVRRLATVGAALGLATGSAAAPAWADEGVEVRRVLTVMVNFQDSRLDDPDAQRALAERTYFGKSGSMSAYYAQVSLGRARFVPATDTPVLGPFDLPMNGAGCKNAEIHDRTAEALKARGIGPDDYEHLSIVFPDQVSKCPWAGLGTVGGGKTWMPHWALDTPDALIHEIGHNLGFPHHARLRCTPGKGLSACAQDGHSGKTPMGAGGAKAGMTAAELLHRGWVTAAERATVTEPGVFTLRTLYSRGPGLRVLEVPLADGERALVELRGPSGALDTAVAGVHLYRVTDGRYEKSALVDFTEQDASKSAPSADALPAGAVVLDPGRGISLQVEERDATTATVTVRFAGKPEPTGREAAGGGHAPGTAAPSTKAAATGGEPTAGPQAASAPAAGPGVAGAGEPSQPLLADSGAGDGKGLLAALGAGLLAVGGGVLFAVRRRRAAATGAAGTGRG
ncbi:hypothetical protein BJP40_02860 [Streptomyces sp. CC53]|uniref:hypothetical protein n=1 Tax=unclassified Streptomyces TaxID=2593676 RepID=UPI0008DCE6A6|nr:MULTISPECIES: hypothetical protein [unclassified Streptomyces]OII63396.1 hypothetical protein BJP40_02860 [Streptomyces sp. CC53]